MINMHRDNIKKFSFILVALLVLVGSFVYLIPKALATTGGGTATIAKDGGAQGAGVTVQISTSHIFTTVLTIPTGGMTLGASSPTFAIPTGFTAPNHNAVATAGEVNTDGEWSVVALGGGCTVSSSPISLLTIATGQVITVDITADCAVGNTITLTYQGTSGVAMGATGLVISTADAGDTSLVTPLIAGSPTITVTDVPATLNVIKHLINNNGGTADASAWTLTVASSNGGTGTGSAVGNESGTAYTLETGKAYAVTESSGVSGYSASSSSDCTIASVVPNTTYTCTITNDDTPPQLTVNMIVVNDGGGTLGVSDFLLFIDTTSVTSGTANTTSIGLHTVSQTSDPGYTATIGGDCATDGTITLVLGDVMICTITNEDIAPQAAITPAPNGEDGSLSGEDLAIANAVPKLPNTGFPPDNKNTLWNIIAAAGTFTILILFYFARRKQKT